MLIAQLSDVHVGGSRYSQELLQTAIGEINAAEPDVVVVAGDLTDDGYPDQYPLAKRELEAIACERVILVPGNHDARNVGYVLFEDTFGARDTGVSGSSARGSTSRSSPSTRRSPTWTRARSGASTTAGSRRASPATPAYGSSCATTT